MKKLLIALFFVPAMAGAQDVTMPDASVVSTADAAVAAPTAEAQPAAAPAGAQPGETAPGEFPAAPFVMSPPSEDGNTLQVIQALQERQALIEARTRVEEARARFRNSECEANRGCQTGGVTGSSSGAIAGPPAAAVRTAIEVGSAERFSIGGIYQKAGGAMSADLFVNGGRVMVEEGSELPGGFKVASITSTGVTVKNATGQKIALSFAEPVDVRGR